MVLVDQAVLARQRGDTAALQQFAKAVFIQERVAADLVPDQLDLEATRSYI
jgi:hypothetical protein